MKCFLICIIFSIQICTSNPIKHSYQLIFPSDLPDPYAKLDGSIRKTLDEFTLCLWSRTKAVAWSAIFSYAVDQPSKDDLIMEYCPDDTIYFRRLKETTTHCAAYGNNKWKWNHICASWTIANGTFQLFVNGRNIRSGIKLSEHPLIPNGKVILAKRVYNLDEEFKNINPLKGHISEVHMWNYILPPSEISQLYNCTMQEGGNVINWNRDSWNLYNGARISTVKLPCGELQ